MAPGLRWDEMLDTEPRTCTSRTGVNTVQYAQPVLLIHESDTTATTSLVVALDYSGVHMAGVYRSTHAIRIARSATIIYQHKPFSFLSPSTSVVGNKQFAMDLLMSKNLRGKHWQRSWGDPRDVPGLQCAGRLDADSTGLMLWTDDPSLRNSIIAQGTSVEKEYIVRVGNHEAWSQHQLEDSLNIMRDGGIMLDDRPLLPASVKRINESQLKFVLTEGRHRQIRRMCALVGLEVLAIKRVRIGELRLGSLPNGCWSSLSPKMAGSLLLPRHPAVHANQPRKPRAAKAPLRVHWRSDGQQQQHASDRERASSHMGHASSVSE